jgi:hypothetical protein
MSFVNKNNNKIIQWFIKDKIFTQIPLSDNGLTYLKIVPPLNNLNLIFIKRGRLNILSLQKSCLNISE